MKNTKEIYLININKESTLNKVKYNLLKNQKAYLICSFSTIILSLIIFDFLLIKNFINILEAL